MNHSLNRILAAFSGRRVLVVGEAMLDTYLEGPCQRLCQEAPVPIVGVTDRREAPGGAANTAVNGAGLQARVDFLSVVGDDPAGVRLRNHLEKHDVSTEHLLVQPGRRTQVKTRISSGSQLLLRFDQGDTSPVDPVRERELVNRLRSLFPLCEAVIVSDYGYGILTSRVIEALAQLQHKSPRVVVADAKQLTAYAQVGLTAVKPNYQEARLLLGPWLAEGPDRVTAIAQVGEKALELTGARIAAITLDCEGALLFERDQPPYRTYARSHPHSRSAGAGDTYLSTLTLALATGASTREAGDLASAAAGLVVAREGTCSCSARELQTFLAVGDKTSPCLADLVACANEHRRRGQRLVFTNGCFDILHSGHIHYLSRARALGDVLIVGVNSDDSIRRLKGPDRPINALPDRLRVLAALGCIDHLIPFDEDTPHQLIQAVNPHVFAKGGDYTLDRLPEAELVAALGGIVQILPFVDERSTTTLIQRIQAHSHVSPRSRPEGTNGKPIRSKQGSGTL